VESIRETLECVRPGSKSGPNPCYLDDDDDGDLLFVSTF